LNNSIKSLIPFCFANPFKDFLPTVLPSVWLPGHLTLSICQAARRAFAQDIGQDILAAGCRGCCCCGRSAYALYGSFMCVDGGEKGKWLCEVHTLFPLLPTWLKAESESGFQSESTIRIAYFRGVSLAVS